MIRLEPRAMYDAAIIGQQGDRLVYSYDLLIDIIAKTFQDDLGVDTDKSFELAIDHIDYNIEGYFAHLQDWPIIQYKEDTEEAK